MKKENKYLYNNGISLITLVITIIVLIILSTLIINIAIDGDLLENTKDVVNQQNKQLNDQQNMVNEVRNLYR